jgi:hypothetical protein
MVSEIFFSTTKLIKKAIDIKRTIKIVDKLSNINEARSPARKINTSIKINKIEIKYISNGYFLFRETNNANNNGNNLAR